MSKQTPRTSTWLPKMDITYSMIRSFQTCPRKCYWSYVEQLESVKRSDALDVGSLFHQMIEHLGYVKTPEMIAPSESDLENYAKALSMANAYHRELGLPMSTRYTNVGSEQTFRIPLRTSNGGQSKTYMLTGKIDGMVQDNKTGEFCLVEHKTTSKVDGAYLDKLALDLQIMIYMLAARHYMAIVAPVCVIYNIVQKPTVKRLGINSKRTEPETLSDYSARMDAQYEEHPEWVSQHQIHFTSRDLEDVAVELGMWADHLTLCRKSGLWPRQTGACHSNFGTCQFWPLCQGNQLNATNYIGTLYQRKDGMHDELNGADSFTSDANDIDNIVF